MTLAEPTSPQSPSLPAGPSTADFSGVAVATENPSNLTSAIEFEAYDPAKIQQKFQGQIFRVLQRWVTILWPFLLLFARRWWDKRTPTSPERQKRRAVQLRETLTALGPAFIKIGQALSTRPDILTGPYLEELSKLQDQLPAFSNEIAYRFIEEELGHPPQDLYAQLTPEPIAAASLGQVYKGQLHSGEWVAVKVQRPDLAEQVTLDIYILRGLAAWVQKNNKSIRSDLVGILDEFAGRLFEEVDYTQEGRNAERFAHLYEYLPEIYIPKIYWEYTNRRVLTMEWITGTKLNQPEKIQAQGIDARHLIDVGVNCSLRQLLEHGLFPCRSSSGQLAGYTGWQVGLP